MYELGLRTYVQNNKNCVNLKKSAVRKVFVVVYMYKASASSPSVIAMVGVMAGDDEGVLVGVLPTGDGVDGADGAEGTEEGEEGSNTGTRLSGVAAGAEEGVLDTGTGLVAGVGDGEAEVGVGDTGVGAGDTGTGAGITRVGPVTGTAWGADAGTGAGGHAKTFNW